MLIDWVDEKDPAHQRSKPSAALSLHPPPNHTLHSVRIAKTRPGTRTRPAKLGGALSRIRINCTVSQSRGTPGIRTRASGVDDEETETGSGGESDAIVAPARVVASQAAVFGPADSGEIKSFSNRRGDSYSERAWNAARGWADGSGDGGGARDGAGGRG